jgi:hypothetical protein
MLRDVEPRLVRIPRPLLHLELAELPRWGVSELSLASTSLDRITDRAHIETGSDSYRFRRTLELRGRHVRSKTTNGVIPNPQPSTEKSSPPGTPVQKRDDHDDDGGSAPALIPSANKEDSLTLPA